MRCLWDTVQFSEECDVIQTNSTDIYKPDLKALAVSTDTWKALAYDRCARGQKVEKGLSTYEDILTQQAEGDKRAGKKSQTQTHRPASTFCCAQCGRGCHSRIGLYSRSRRCSPLIHQRRNAIVPPGLTDVYLRGMIRYQ